MGKIYNVAAARDLPRPPNLPLARDPEAFKNLRRSQTSPALRRLSSVPAQGLGRTNSAPAFASSAVVKSPEKRIFSEEVMTRVETGTGFVGNVGIGVGNAFDIFTPAGAVANIVGAGVNAIRAHQSTKAINQTKLELKGMKDQIAAEAEQTKSGLAETPIEQLRAEFPHGGKISADGNARVTRGSSRPTVSESTFIPIEEEPSTSASSASRATRIAPPTSSRAEIHAKEKLVSDKKEELQAAVLTAASGFSNATGSIFAVADAVTGKTIAALGVVSAGFSALGAVFGGAAGGNPIIKGALATLGMKAPNIQFKKIEELSSAKQFSRVEKDLFKSNDEVLLNKAKKGVLNSNKLNLTSVAVNATAVGASLAEAASTSTGWVASIAIPVAVGLFNGAVFLNARRNASHQNKAYETIQGFHEREFANTDAARIDDKIARFAAFGLRSKEEYLDYFFTLKNNGSENENDHVNEYLLSRCQTKGLAESYLVANKENWNKYLVTKNPDHFKAMLASMRGARES